MALLTLSCGAARADVLAVVHTLRAGGCGGLVPAAPALRHSAALDRVAARWAGGASLDRAAADYGYAAAAPVGVRASGADSDLLPQLRRSQCHTLTAPPLRDIGAYRAGAQVWLVLTPGPGRAPAPGQAPPAAPEPPPRSLAPAQATAPAAWSVKALQLINAARARGAVCGREQFSPVPPVALSGTLADVALGHAADMAAHGYFEHQDLAGHTPADRVRASGYRETLVGENIAYGTQSIEETVRGWLDSPGHCANIMDGRFSQMGLASAQGHGTRHGLYWVQVLAAPKA